MIHIKIAVFSDTHGYTSVMLDAIRDHTPDAVIHCGDGCSDLSAINDCYPNIPVYNVCGNCDNDARLPLVITKSIDNIRILVTHGHTYGVRYGNLDRLVYAALEANANIAFYGHTHRERYEVINGVTVINPGSAGKGNQSYGILSTNPDSTFEWKFYDY